MNAITIRNLPDEVRSFKDHFSNVAHVLQVAKSVMYWKDQYKLSDEEVLEFLAFKKQFLTVPDDYKNLNDGQKLRLLKEIKEGIKNKTIHATQEQITEVLFAFFEKTLPMEYQFWPNFEEDPEASFEQFLKESIFPYAQLIGREDGNTPLIKWDFK